MSFLGIDVAGNALGAFQSVENIISDNIANVNTPGASQENPLLVQSQPIAGKPTFGTQVNPGTVGQGVTVKAIERIHDNALDRLYRGAYSSQNYYSALNTGLTTLQQTLNEPTGGVSNAYRTFETALAQLASVNTNASNATANRANVLSTAQSLTSTLNSVANSISAQADTTLTTITNTVSTVNGLLSQIATLNGEIREGTAAGESPNTYLDQRDYALDQLAQYVPVTVVNEANGSSLVTLNGHAVVDDTVTYDLAKPITVNAANGLKQVVIGQIDDPNPLNPTPLQFGSGQLGGLTDFYNTKVANYTASLNAFASALSTQFNRVNESGYDQNGQPGSALFTSTGGSSSPIQASTITVGAVAPSQLALASASTESGLLTQSINASTTAVSPSTTIDGNPAFNNPAPAAGLSGTITLNVDGVTKTYAYNTATTDTSISAFEVNFNALQAGVTASYDSTAQKIIFARDPSNESLAFQASTGYTPTATFTISDSNGTAGTQPAPNVAAGGLLDLFGAGALNGTPQVTSNSFSSSDNANATHLQDIFAADVGIPPVSSTSTGAIAVGTQTIVPTGGLGNIIAGAQLTFGAGTANQENVTVTSVNSSAVPPTITATFVKAHPAGESIQAAQTETLSSYYGNFVSSVGYDGAGAASGLSTQTNLTNGIETRRQSVSGINLDQETQRLIQYQAAYQAVAKTFSVLDSLLQATINQI